MPTSATITWLSQHLPSTVRLKGTAEINTVNRARCPGLPPQWQQRLDTPQPSAEQRAYQDQQCCWCHIMLPCCRPTTTHRSANNMLPLVVKHVNTTCTAARVGGHNTWCRAMQSEFQWGTNNRTALKLSKTAAATYRALQYFCCHPPPPPTNLFCYLPCNSLQSLAMGRDENSSRYSSSKM